MEKINIAEILKDCPSNMELNCTMYEDVHFDYVDELNIIHCYIHRKLCKSNITFNQYGTPNSDTKSKCVIFPKGKTTWEGFVPPCKFKDGDIISMENACGCHTFIYNNITDECGSYGYYAIITSIGNFKVNNFCSGSKYRLATEEEKEKLFKAIKDNGYKWNAKTRTLEKLINPEFKIGDRIRTKKDAPINNIPNILITKVNECSYEGVIGYTTNLAHISFKYQDLYELVTDKFNISTLKPFDKVLVRTNVHHPTWSVDFYGGYDIKVGGSFTPFAVTGGKYFQQCIPYEGNEHLRGTTNDCSEYYKNW